MGTYSPLPLDEAKLAGRAPSPSPQEEPAPTQKATTKSNGLRTFFAPAPGGSCEGLRLRQALERHRGRLYETGSEERLGEAADPHRFPPYDAVLRWYIMCSTHITPAPST